MIAIRKVRISAFAFIGGGSGDGGGGELPSWISDFLDQLHLGFSVLAGILLGVVGYRGTRWIDREHQVNGSFEPFKSRSLDRVERGRFVVSLAGAVLGLVLGTLLALQVPLGIQVIVVLGAVVLIWKKPW